MKALRIIFAVVAITIASTMATSATIRFFTAEVWASLSTTAPTFANSVKLTASAPLVGLSRTGTDQIKIFDPARGTTWYLYAYDGVFFYKLYSAGGW